VLVYFFINLESWNDYLRLENLAPHFIISLTSTWFCNVYIVYCNMIVLWSLWCTLFLYNLCVVMDMCKINGMVVSALKTHKEVSMVERCNLWLVKGNQIWHLGSRWWSMPTFTKFKVCSKFQFLKFWKIRSLFCIYLYFCCKSWIMIHKSWSLLNCLALNPFPFSFGQVQI
jgi:hypothetical protein